MNLLSGNWTGYVALELVEIGIYKGEVDGIEHFAYFNDGMIDTLSIYIDDFNKKSVSTSVDVSFNKELVTLIGAPHFEQINYVSEFGLRPWIWPVVEDSSAIDTNQMKFARTNYPINSGLICMPFIYSPDSLYFKIKTEQWTPDHYVYSHTFQLWRPIGG